MRFLRLFLFFVLLTSFAYSQNYKQVKIYINSKADIANLYKAGLDFDHPYLTKDNAVILFLSDNAFEKLKSTGYRYDVLINNWKDYYNNLPKLSTAEKLQFKDVSRMKYGVTEFGYGSMGGYYTLAEVNAQLDTMRAQYPNLITAKQSIGTTVEGRPIYMVKISDNPDVNENEPQVLYTSIHHAREPMGMQQLVYYMYYLLENYNTDPSVKYLVDHREIYFIPVVNPDGYEYNHQTDPNGGGYWRKNRRNNGSGIYGVDLNRNYGPYAYWNSSNGGSSTDPSSETYRGTAPFSEPEVQAIRDFLMTKHIRNTLNYHTYGNDLIYPYGALSHETPDSLIFREFAADITTYNGYTYGTDLQTVGYSTRGNSDDYEYDGDIASTNGNIFAMTPEVGGFSDGFWPPQSRIYPLAEENLLPNLYYTWVAGEFVKLNNANFSQQYFNPGDNVEMLPEFKNKGLSTGYNINVELSSNSSYITVNNATASFDSIEARSTAQVSSPLTFTISSSTPIDTEIKLVVKSLIDGAEMSSDTVSIITGIPTYAFVDTTNNINNLWTITSTPTNPHWGITTSTYHSAPNSYTDSPTGNYADNATVTLTLTNSIDLSGYSNPRLTYWTKWDIENDWDYAQTKISTNNGSTWTPLQGLYTNPGVGSFQPNGEPLYDGTQLNWVKEEISLASYSSSQVKFRFELKSDINTNRDGWYLDDIGVIIYTAVPVELTSFTANSNESSVSLNWITSTETNNKGFEIQRCADDKTNGPKNWKTLGFIAGSGTSSESHNYSFVDKNPISGSSLYRLKQVDFNGTFRIYGPVSSSYMGVTEYSLQQNYPNPFNPSTVIKYSIPKAGFVTLKVYNVLGAEVASLVNGYMEAGNHEINFSTNISGKELGSGIYFYTIKAGNYTQTKKMVVLK